MKILFLEADGGFSANMERFISKLQSEGHFVCLVPRCYVNIATIKAALKDKPAAIAFSTTFTYRKRFEQLFRLAESIRKPVELWDCGSYADIVRDIPDNMKQKFIPYDVNIFSYTEGHLLLAECKKLL